MMNIKYVSMGLKMDLDFLKKELTKELKTNSGLTLVDDNEQNVNFLSMRLILFTSKKEYNLGYIELIYSNETGFYLNFQENMPHDIKLSIDITFEKLLQQYSKARWSDGISDEIIVAIPNGGLS